MSFKYNSNTHSFTDAGTYTLSVSELNNKNYTLSGVEGQTSPALIIKPQSVVISWNLYDDVVYDGTERELIATVKGSMDSTEIPFTYVEGTRTFTNVGTYTAKVDGLADKNYTLDNAVGQKEISVSVTVRTVEAVWSGETDVVYDGAEHTAEQHDFSELSSMIIAC